MSNLRLVSTPVLEVLPAALPEEPQTVTEALSATPIDPFIRLSSAVLHDIYAAADKSDRTKMAQARWRLPSEPLVKWAIDQVDGKAPAHHPAAMVLTLCIHIGLHRILDPAQQTGDWSKYADPLGLGSQDFDVLIGEELAVVYVDDKPVGTVFTPKSMADIRERAEFSGEKDRALLKRLGAEVPFYDIEQTTFPYIAKLKPGVDPWPERTKAIEEIKAALKAAFMIAAGR